jgi:hypothetical protein
MACTNTIQKPPIFNILIALIAIKINFNWIFPSDRYRDKDNKKTRAGWVVIFNQV